MPQNYITGYTNTRKICSGVSELEKQSKQNIFFGCHMGNWILLNTAFENSLSIQYVIAVLSGLWIAWTNTNVRYMWALWQVCPNDDKLLQPKNVKTGPWKSLLAQILTQEVPRCCNYWYKWSWYKCLHMNLIYSKSARFSIFNLIE